jgi:ParB/RepB/Spo0J family partition protein
MNYKIEALKVGSLEASATNPRKRFDPEKLNELSASIAAQGVLAPLLVRPRGKVYEIVAGERRWRAAKQAGLDQVPCLVREMSDGEVLEAQLIENLQRHDLEPMEEARGFHAMMDLRGPDGQPIYTAERVAEKIGKGLSMVYQRLKLLVLPKAGQDAVEMGRLEVSAAQMIARIPTERLRERALKEVLEPKGYDRPLTKLETKALIERRYMCSLHGSAFDQEDATLHPEGQVCSKCPHRAGNCPEVEGVRADTCMNPTCFSKKTELAHERWKLLHSGKRVLTPDENAKNVEGDRLVAWSSKLVALDDAPMEHLLNASARGRKLPTWRELIEGRGAEIVIARKADNSALECVDRELAMEAARLNGHEIFKLSSKEEQEAFKAQQRKQAAEIKERRAAKVRILEAVMLAARAEDDAETWLQELCVLDVLTGFDVAELLQARKLSSSSKLIAAIRKAKGADLIGLAAQIVLADCGFDQTATLTREGARLLKTLGVDPKKLEREAAAAAKGAKAKPGAAGKAAKKGKKA